MLSSVPFGATPQDTAEYALGKVHVSVVLPESNGAIDPNTENWTSAQISDVKTKVQQGVSWWSEVLEREFPNTVHTLDFHFDFTFADAPFSTSYEPISRISNHFTLWVGEFLASQGQPIVGGDFTTSIRAFNHDQRVKSGSDWAFTIFVVNNANDADTMFAEGGDFRNAFAYAGGQFFVAQASRPASTFAHETGHMFYAFDEYFGGESYTSRRGYYNTQNLNGLRNHPDPDSRVTSIMDSATQGYPAHALSPSAMEMIGWKDSDGDGVFDAMDVPHRLSGSGWHDAVSGQYRFVGAASVTPLKNQNPSILSHKSDITLNVISRAEYRIDGGAWTTAQTYGAPVVDLNLSLPVPAGQHSIEIRVIDDATGVTSPIFSGSTAAPSATVQPGVNGFLWDDANGNGVRDPGEQPLAGWAVELRNAQGQPLDLLRRIEPDDSAAGAELNTISPHARLTAVGLNVPSAKVLVASNPGGASTGTRIFAHETLNGTSNLWKGEEQQLMIEFTTPVNMVSIDAIADTAGDFARLEIYTAGFQLIDRITTGEMAAGQTERLFLSRPNAEIGFAIVRGHGGTAVLLDNLQFGAQTTVVADANGAYSLSHLPAGTYQVKPVAPGNASPTAPVGGVQSVSLTAGQAAQNINFGFTVTTPIWHNTAFPADVNGSGAVTMEDVLLVIQSLRDKGIRSLEGEPGSGPPYVDVDNSNSVTLNDALLVVQHLRSQLLAGGEPVQSAQADASSSEPAALAAAAEGERSTLLQGHLGAAVSHWTGGVAGEAKESVSEIARELRHMDKAALRETARTLAEQFAPRLGLSRSLPPQAADRAVEILSKLRSRDLLEDALDEIAADVGFAWRLGTE